MPTEYRGIDQCCLHRIKNHILYDKLVILFGCNHNDNMTMAELLRRQGMVGEGSGGGGELPSQIPKSDKTVMKIGICGSEM